MPLAYTTIEEIISDENFLAWYFRSNDVRAKEWERVVLEHPGYYELSVEAVKWLKAHPLEEEEIPATQVDAAFARLQTSLDQKKVVAMPGRRKYWIPAAAAILALAILGVLWANRESESRFENPYGLVSDYKLPDGSQVTLNANSEITLGKKWEHNSDREVWLEGEAFFKVQKNTSHNRFIVHARGMDIIVTGTQFNAVSREDEASVLLTEGSVIIRTGTGKEIAMKPGDFVKLQNDVPSLMPADQEKVLAWKQSKLDFDNTPMNEVAKIITRHYGVKVSLADSSIGQRTISGVMPNDNLDVLIRALEALGEYRISKTENGIVISEL